MLAGAAHDFVGRDTHVIYFVLAVITDYDGAFISGIGCFLTVEYNVPASADIRTVVLDDEVLVAFHLAVLVGELSDFEGGGKFLGCNRCAVFAEVAFGLHRVTGTQQRYTACCQDRNYIVKFHDFGF